MHLHRNRAASTLAALVCASACSTPDTPEARTTNSPAPTASPTAQTPADLCTSLVGYWVKEALRGNKWAGIDWEQKGLSNEQYELHEAVLTEARAEQKKNGTAAAERLADRRVRQKCEQTKGATGSSENWRDPTEQVTPTWRPPR
ncbi:hypothetical protein ACIO3O_21180 [Streptomyces sp. NPDC087440]|uniref:hypothetical protein n=1 Tax=Streptomyces sp. NPDC087440 TaxID=3365790 RepID=UPI0037FC8A4D